MKKQVHFMRKGIIALLLCAILLPLGEPALVSPAAAAKVTQSEINALKDKSSALAAEKKEIQAQISAIRSEKNAAQTEKNLIEQQINVIQSEINNVKEQIAKYDLLIEQKQAEIEETQKRVDAQYELFCQRVRSMEEEGQVSYWSILFTSKDFSELLDNYMMIDEIMAYDNSVMESLQALQAQLEAEQAELDQVKAELEDVKAAQEASKRELAAKEAEVDQLIGKISEEEDALEAREAELKRAGAAIDAEVKKMEQQLAAQIANVPSESGYLWPLPSGYITLSSLYGKRTHPLTGRPNNHGGIDIPAPRNTNIYAAKSGTVSISTYNSSYGNYVVVSHSDGTSTLYAHMNKRAVSVGQTVKQGAVIGYVGTTGSSTGNHLHYEVRINGNRTDPVNYYKNKTLYVTYGGRTAILNH